MLFHCTTTRSSVSLPIPVGEGTTDRPGQEQKGFSAAGQGNQLSSSFNINIIDLSLALWNFYHTLDVFVKERFCPDSSQVTQPHLNT